MMETNLLNPKHNNPMDKKLLFLDVETTGLYPSKSGIIQVAGIIEINGEVIEEFNLNMAPFPEDWINDQALKANGVLRETLFDRPDPNVQFQKLISILEKHVDKRAAVNKLWFLAYNSNFDNEFMRAWFKKCGDKDFSKWFHNPDLCVMRMAGLALMDERVQLDNFKQGTVARKLGIEVDESKLHDALYDIHITRKIFKKITE